MKVLLYFSDRITSKEEIRETVLNSGIRAVQTKPDFVLVFGGDGTLLKCEEKYPQIPKVLVSESSCSLGYLAATSVENLEVILDELKKKRYVLSKRMKLDVKYSKKESVLNEVLITSRLRGRSIKIELLKNGKPLFIVNCDGVILFTPTGSTAYSMSCGGPILKTKGIGITLVNPHLSPTKYLVLDEKDKVMVKLLAGEGVMILDGGRPIKVRGPIKIEKSKNTAQLVFLKEKRIPEVRPPRVMTV